MRAVPMVCASFVLLAALVRTPSSARADDGRLRLMHEPIPFTDVPDAFDGHDRFDIDVHLDYVRVRDRGDIYREQRDAQGEVERRKVAESQVETNVLSLEVDAGLWRDLMAFVRMPLVLRDVRELSAGDGDLSALAGSPRADGSTQPLFGLPFAAPTRAGLDYIAFGGAWALLNQMRTSWSPTWVVRLEGRRAIGTPLTACTARVTGGTVCGSAGEEDRDRARGVSRGLSALAIDTRFSRRYRHAEPYAGLALLVQWPSSARDAFQPSGQGNARPGPESTATLGVALIPWEDRGNFQRVTLDLRLDVTHVARGTNYGPLFDALGSSSDPSLARSREGVGFHGLTEIEQHLRYGGRIGIELQAARYVRFAAGTTLHWVTDHALSGRAACTGSAPVPFVSEDGVRCSSARVDARERGVIDSPGRRFLIRDQLLLGIYAQATAMF